MNCLIILIQRIPSILWGRVFKIHTYHKVSNITTWNYQIPKHTNSQMWNKLKPNNLQIQANNNRRVSVNSSKMKLKMNWLMIKHSNQYSSSLRTMWVKLLKEEAEEKMWANLKQIRVLGIIILDLLLLHIIRLRKLLHSIENEFKYIDHISIYI